MAPAGTTATPAAGAWSGYARLTDTQIRALATALVNQITQRQAANGNRPFLSLGEFINRSLTNDALGRKGALQAAIDDAGLNDTVAAQTLTAALQTAAAFPFPENGVGDTASAGAGFIRQADLLQQIGSSLSARSDTISDAENTNRVRLRSSRNACTRRRLRHPRLQSPRDSHGVEARSMSEARRQEFTGVVEK